jgi:hypothetical protein
MVVVQSNGRDDAAQKDDQNGPYPDAFQGHPPRGSKEKKLFIRQGSVTSEEEEERTPPVPHTRTEPILPASDPPLAMRYTRSPVSNVR